MKRHLPRLVNALFWLGVWIVIVVWTETFRHWGAMVAEGMVPFAFWGYLHLVLGPRGTAGH